MPPLRQRIQQDHSELDDLLTHSTRRLLGKASPDIVRMVRRRIDQQLGPDYDWPGNVRELEQCLRRILLNRTYAGVATSEPQDPLRQLVSSIKAGTADARQLLTAYCRLLYRRHGSYEAVARRVQLDRRTVRKHILDPSR